MNARSMSNAMGRVALVGATLALAGTLAGCAGNLDDLYLGEPLDEGTQATQVKADDGQKPASEPAPDQKAAAPEASDAADQPKQPETPQADAAPEQQANQPAVAPEQAQEAPEQQPAAPEAATPQPAGQQAEPAASDTATPVAVEPLPRPQLADYPQAFAAYQQILQSSQAGIEAYTWQLGASGQPVSLPVAVWDIMGDDTPELLLLSVSPNTSDQANLVVYTFSAAGGLTRVYNEPLDHAAGGGVRWYLFQASGVKDLHAYVSSGDEQWDYDYLTFGTASSGSALEVIASLGEHRDAAGTSTYSLNGTQISASEYQTKVAGLTNATSAIVLFSAGEKAVADALASHDCVAMSYIDALAYLSGMLNSHMLPESATRAYTAEELADFSNWELFVARNEIFARYGRIFATPELADYFAQQIWYQPLYAGSDFDAMPSPLNEFEAANVETIRSVEVARGSEYV